MTDFALRLGTALSCIGPDSNPLKTDQRGFTRVAGMRWDVGAHEFPTRLLPTGSIGTVTECLMEFGDRCRDPHKHSAKFWVR